MAVRLQVMFSQFSQAVNVCVQVQLMEEKVTSAVPKVPRSRYSSSEKIRKVTAIETVLSSAPAPAPAHVPSAPPACKPTALVHTQCTHRVS